MSRKPYIGIATPQANPTVEIEARQLLDNYAIPLATRLTSPGETPADRLVAYIEQLEVAIGSFDTLELGVFAFACTGSSYLVGAEREGELVKAAEAASGIPIVTATAAIAEELAIREVSRIAILAPYPESLINASVAYWTEAGLDVANCQRIDIGEDTRAIYDLTDSEVSDAIDRYDTADAELLLLSGTGMPTVHALLGAGTPMLSSNLCLAGAVLRRAGLWPAASPIDIQTLCLHHG